LCGYTWRRYTGRRDVDVAGGTEAGTIEREFQISFGKLSRNDFSERSGQVELHTSRHQRCHQKYLTIWHLGTHIKQRKEEKETRDGYQILSYLPRLLRHTFRDTGPGLTPKLSRYADAEIAPVSGPAIRKKETLILETMVIILRRLLCQLFALD
jgi:hypothetical protein